MIEFSEIFNDLVGQISPDIKVNYQVNNKYYVDSTKWSRKGKTISGMNALGVQITKKITNVSNDEFIELEDMLIVDDTLTIDSPFNITGTKIATNLEWTKASNFAIDKTPLVWLLDTFEEQEYGAESSIERIIDLKVFFLDETDIKNFYTSDHKREVIQPMMNLKDKFLKEIKKNRTFKAVESDKTKYFSRFGTESTQGFEKNILDANLSGLLLSLSLTKFKGNCIC
jgi:hypothetical protein